MENKQKYATVIVEVKSPDLKTRIMKGVHAKKGKSKFYITDIPQRQYPSRNMTYSDEEVEHKPKKCPKEKKDKRPPKSSKNKKFMAFNDHAQNGGYERLFLNFFQGAVLGCTMYSEKG